MSLFISEMGGTKGRDGVQGQLYVITGLLRTVVDQVTGDLSDTRTRYIGSRPVKLFRVTMQGGEAVLAMSSRTWISYYYSNRFHLTPLSYDTLEYAAGFSSEQCPEGIVAISTNTLRILALEKLGAVFNQVAFPLEFTPRKFVVHPESGMMIIIETDHNAYTKNTNTQRKIQMAKEMRDRQCLVMAGAGSPCHILYTKIFRIWTKIFGKIWTKKHLEKYPLYRGREEQRKPISCVVHKGKIIH